MKNVYRIVMILALVLLTPTYAFAADPPGIITGTKDLLDAALGWLLIIIPVACGFIVAWHAFLKQMNEGDPAQAAAHNRAMKNAIIAGAIAFSASGIVKAVLAFYGG